ncbi:MAG TPA: Trp biosynthesis-associated membrane protein [Dermatophilaceae bacterium]|nr:Trp biosynthesis-associated membrane protein [Dermatophilaceae bacterium]
MRRLTGKAGMVLLALLGAAVVVVAASRPWVTGRVSDAVLGTSTLSATGGESAPGLVALALVVAAAALAVVTTGRVARTVALVLHLGAVLGAIALTVRVLLDPEGVLGPRAAAAAGRTGSLPTTAATTAWPWVALAGLAVALGSWVLALAGRRRWGGLSSRYDAPAGEAREPGEAGKAGDASAGGPPTAASQGARGERVSSQWDQLSAGIDPTDVGPGPNT